MTGKVALACVLVVLALAPSAWSHPAASRNDAGDVDDVDHQTPTEGEEEQQQEEEGRLRRWKRSMQSMIKNMTSSALHGVLGGVKEVFDTTVGWFFAEDYDAEPGAGAAASVVPRCAPITLALVVLATAGRLS